MSEITKPERDGIYALSAEERKELAWALLRRPRRGVNGLEAFRLKYPSAPAAMLATAVHHVYVDGPDAVIDFLAEAELAIREPAHEIGYGTSWHLLYHVYNWLQFRAILPEGKTDLVELVKQLKQAVAEDDRDFIVATLQELGDLVDGSRQAPDFEAS